MLPHRTACRNRIQPAVNFCRQPRLTGTVNSMCARYFAYAAAAATLAAMPSLTAAAECAVTSGSQRVAVLELYTSEGCDSCPPADKWISELPAKKLNVDRVVPLAFHVDYWNQLGWIDPFSQPVFSARQRQHSKRRGVSFVVTPQLLLNGQDYRRGGYSMTLTAGSGQSTAPKRRPGSASR